MSLNEIKADREAVVSAINGDSRFLSRITSIGITPGCKLEVIRNDKNRPMLAFIFAITFNMPCVVALAATYQETHSAKWTAKIAAYYTFGALLIAMIVYHLGLLIW